MQGQTIKKGSKVVVSWSKRMPPSLAYMMLSRSECVEDLFITGDFDPSKIKCDPKALKEAERLDEISLTKKQTDIQSSNQFFGFALVNIRSLNKNLQYLGCDSVMLRNDVVFVTETWHDSKIHKIHKLDGYQSVFANGTAKGKGAGVFFRSDATIEVCEEELYQFIKFSNPKITIFCLYVSKGCDFGQLIESLKKYNFNSDANTCLIGDMNFDAFEANDFTRFMSNLKFNQIVCRATHLDGCKDPSD